MAFSWFQKKSRGFDSRIELSAVQQKIRAALPEAERQQLDESLRSIAQACQAMAEQRGIAPPIILVDMELGFSSTINRLIPHGWFGVRKTNAIYIDPCFVSGLAALSHGYAAPPPLQFTRDELSTVLAHEIGHLASCDHWDVIKPEHEYEADRRMIELGGTAEAMASLCLKMTRHERELAYRYAEKAQQSETGTYRDRTAAEWLELRKQAAECLQATEDYPALAERYQQAKIHQQSWREREDARSQSSPLLR